MQCDNFPGDWRDVCTHKLIKTIDLPELTEEQLLTRDCEAQVAELCPDGTELFHEVNRSRGISRCGIFYTVAASTNRETLESLADFRSHIPL